MGIGIPLDEMPVGPDLRALFDYIGDYGKEKQSAPKFNELLEFILERNEANSDSYAEVVYALKASGFKPKLAKEATQYKTINKYCDDLVIKATNNRLDPMIGRESEVTKMIEVLARYKKKNPLLVGKAGTGKTAVVEGLASAIAQGKVPEAIKSAKIFSTSVSKLMAGTKFRGDVEEKVELLTQELIKYGKEKNVPVYLFIDEIHQICSAGSSSQDGSNISNILKPKLASGELALIGATTDKEYKRTIQKDDALDRRLQRITINEPSDKETLEILKRGVAPVLAAYHGVDYSNKVLQRTVELSSKYILDKAQPDKSIAIIDSIGARLRTTEKRVKTAVKDVEKYIAEATGTPISAFKQRAKSEEYVDIEAELNKVVFGQADSIKKIAEVYERAKAGLNEDGQPIGSILAVGPTGTGKTECAKSLAEITKANFFKINMGEFTEEHSVAKLFGAPPGYVGHSEGGLLTNQIRKNPHTVLLLDEVEKAHAKVFEALLGIIDGAKMTDGEGNEVDFRNVMIIMTSNVGAAQAASRKLISLTGSSIALAEAKAQVSEKALQATFSPEFRNKLTAVVNFNSLGPDEIRSVTDKFLSKAAEKLMDRKGIKVEFTDSVREYVNENGFDAQFGARPIKKLIDAKVVDSLVKPLLKGEVSKGDTLVFDISEGDVVYSKKELITETV